jgi:hypothetical protein
LRNTKKLSRAIQNKWCQLWMGIYHSVMEEIWNFEYLTYGVQAISKLNLFLLKLSYHTYMFVTFSNFRLIKIQSKNISVLVCTLICV